ncbi:MAG: GNAT family N-acetyltransferase [Saprospiraceae bacterium]|nr:GNAT family N-acetyltransferase [Saprospiraceae bacterium]
MTKSNKINFTITKHDQKRIFIQSTHYNLILNNSDPIIIESLIQDILIPGAQDHKIIKYDYSVEDPVAKKLKTDDWIEWSNKAYNTHCKHIIHLYVLPTSASIHLRHWKKIAFVNQVENALMRRLKKTGFPILLLKMIPENRIENKFKITSLTKNASISNHSNQFELRCSHPIIKSEISGIESINELRRYIASRFKILESSKRESLIQILIDWIESKKPLVKIPETIDPLILEQEINNLSPEHILIENKQLIIAVAAFQEIPNLMLELGRLREITFRAHNEGTGKAIDLDSYDPFYKHLFAWDKTSRKILGAYRIGEGHKILPIIGRKGLYITSLFKIHASMDKFLLQCVELGRSFITPENQKSNLILFLLWKGLYYYILKNPNNKFIIGPVSISKDYSKMSRLLIMDFLSKYHAHPEYSKFFKPKKPYRFFKNNLSTEIIIRNFENDLHKFDKLISEIQANSVKIPVLLRQYLKQNAKVLAFNRDPQFQNVLDALIILELKNISEDFQSYFEKK